MLTHTGDKRTTSSLPGRPGFWPYAKKEDAMRLILIFTLLPLANTAHAHPGHLADAAGHDHWAAGIAIGLAGLAAILGALKDRKDRAQAEEETQEATDAEEQPA